MNASPNHQPSRSGSSIRMDARLDTMTRAKLEDLAATFHQSRAAVLSYIMEWGLSRGLAETLDGGESQGPVCHLYLYVDTELHARVERAATAAGVKIAPWLRHMVRQVTITDFPASWQEAGPEERSHDSRDYDTRFMLRLDEPSQTKLQQLVQQLGASKAEIMRQLIAQANDENFRKSWQMRAAEHSRPPMRQQTRHHQERTR